MFRRYPVGLNFTLHWKRAEWIRITRRMKDTHKLTVSSQEGKEYDLKVQVSREQYLTQYEKVFATLEQLKTTERLLNDTYQYTVQHYKSELENQLTWIIGLNNEQEIPKGKKDDLCSWPDNPQILLNRRISMFIDVGNLELMTRDPDSSLGYSKRQKIERLLKWSDHNYKDTCWTGKVIKYSLSDERHEVTIDSYVGPNAGKVIEYSLSDERHEVRIDS